MVYDMRNISWKPSKKWENLWSKIRYISRFNLPACCHHNFSKSDRSEKSQPWADCYFRSQTFFFTKFISYSSHRIWGCCVDYIKGIMKYLYHNQILTDQILSSYNICFDGYYKNLLIKNKLSTQQTLASNKLFISMNPWYNIKLYSSLGHLDSPSTSSFRLYSLMF